VTDVPPALVESIRNREMVLFAGAGLSLSAGLPSAASIARALAAKLQRDGRPVNSELQGQLDKVAEKFELTYKRPQLVSDVQLLVQANPSDAPSPSHLLLASLVKKGFVKTIVTTNYDTLIEDACSSLGTAITVVAHDTQLQSARAADKPVLFKIHGDFAHPELLVLTPLDFQRWDRQPGREQIVQQVQAIFGRNALFFLGSSLSDFDVLQALLDAEPSTPGSPELVRLAAVFPQANWDDLVARLRLYKVEAFQCPDSEAMLRSVLLRLPVQLLIRHLLFNYPSWYLDEPSRYGGIETFVSCLKEHPGDFLHETVPIFSSEMLGALPSRLGGTTYPAYPGSFFFFNAATQAALNTILRERRTGQASAPDLVHMHFLAFAPMFEKAGIPVLCTSHSLLSTDLAFTNGLFDGHPAAGGRYEVAGVYEAEKEAASSVEYITVLSNSHEQELRRIGARSIRRMNPPFDRSRFRADEEPESARERGSPRLPQKFTLAYVGRPDRRKGVEVLIGACKVLSARGRVFQLLVVGYGFRLKAGRLDFGNGLYWFDISLPDGHDIDIKPITPGNIWEIAQYYAASDVVVIPSLYEPMGYVALEAMACGRPVVAAKVGGLAETITDNANGLLFEPGNKDDLADKLDGLYADKGRRKALGKSARAYIDGLPSVDDVARQWQEAYRYAAFAFGESLYPPPELLELIQEKCNKAIGAGAGLYSLAQLGCDIAKEVIVEHPDLFQLPEGVPVDNALLRAIARELQHALLRQGMPASFSPLALAIIMNDLALAKLNLDAERPEALLQAEETKRLLEAPGSQAPWLQSE